jgi:hypothetical protein
MDLKQWLEVNGLGKYASLFAENEIDFDLLPRLSKAICPPTRTKRPPRRKSNAGNSR